MDADDARPSTRAAGAGVCGLGIAALALGNELVDITGGAVRHIETRELAYVEAATDSLLTIAIPTLLVIVARFRPGLYERIGLAR